MKKVYVVTSGEYSDYGIEACFSTKENAQKYCDILNTPDRWSPAGIEEYELDKYILELRQGLTPFFGRINEAGDINELHKYHKLDDRMGFDVRNNLFMAVLAKDENHARKIIAERHAEVKANGWPESDGMPKPVLRKK